ncbi:ABC transporter substrate-binding protein [Eubacterium oxidoreducens]|uniref:NitT/TauT family transport system substrate-binding protein n=1 Tax=Eubacterium oxidoreducens TaxID=1732 RepID=A0A1G6A265_EUBOX|nr:ABC transporter substrate-binding protein [Eubacterium oxidoreducens]SDB02512.1 NitT/TauT family transport system substrate-binding protein [Eubacterium oxidoreducens]
MRKKIIAGILAVTLLLTFTACSNDEQNNSNNEAQEANSNLEKTEFNLGYLNSTAHLLAFVAKEEGYFEEEGINVTLTQFSNATELSSGLESGKLDVAFIGSVPALTFQSQGHDLTIFGGAMTNGHGYVIKSEYTEGLSDWDITILKGRNVASVKNSVQDAELQILLKDANIEIGEGDDKVNIIYFESQKDAYAALQNDTIDAASVYSPYASLAKGQGYEVVYYCSEEEALKNQPCCRQVATTSALSENPNSYNAFERALIKAYKFSQENQEGTIADVKKYIDIEEDYIKTEVYGGYSVSSPDPDKQATVTLKDTIVELGYTEDYDIDKLYNTDIYKNALDSLISENPDDAVYKELQDHFNQYE